MERETGGGCVGGGPDPGSAAKGWAGVQGLGGCGILGRDHGVGVGDVVGAKWGALGFEGWRARGLRAGSGGSRVG